MKYIIIFAFLSIAAQAQSTKHALIIAIGDYNTAATGWGKISSLNDVPLMQIALQKQDFKNENIKIVLNTNATGIINAINELKNQVKTGDMVVIHYSGHGVQLQDDNGDEPDKLDEAIVPLEAIYSPEELKNNNYIRDDMLGELIFQLRKKLGTQGHLLLSLDSCHSGAGSRGATVRGGKPALTEANFDTIKEENQSQSLLDAPSSSGGAAEGLSKFVLFAGASSNEFNFETNANGKQVGSLSYTLSKVLNQLQPNDTYRQVFAKIRVEMALVAPRQNPVMEGDIDYQFFGGNLVKHTPYIEILKVQDPKNIKLNAGKVADINPNDVFVLYPAGTLKIPKDSALYRGTITESDNFTSVLTLTKTLPTDAKPQQFWAFRIKQSYGESKINVYAENRKRNFPKSLLDSLQNWQFMKIVTDSALADYRVEFTQNNEALVKINATMLPYLNMLPIAIKNANSIKELKKVMVSAGQVRFLKSLKLNSQANPEISLSLIRVKLNSSREKVVALFDAEKDTVTRIFSENDSMVLKLTNNSKTKLYFNIVAIQPDEKIVPLIPSLNDNNDVNSYQIAAGSTIVLDYKPITGFSPPCGAEMMKVFATPKPINLYPIIESQTEITHRAKGEENPIESLLGTYHSRGPNSVANTNLGYSSEYVYTIVGSKTSPCK